MSRLKAGNSYHRKFMLKCIKNQQRDQDTQQEDKRLVDSFWHTFNSGSLKGLRNIDNGCMAVLNFPQAS